jgi:HTH-type transcriptional regulator/antitoxin HigA|nr:MAG TPA: Regulatory protein [Bacteriophage sp.]
MKVGEFLLSRVFSTGMFMRDVSMNTGIDQRLLNNIVDGKREINADIAKKLETVLGVPAIVWMTWQAVDELNKDKV